MRANERKAASGFGDFTGNVATFTKTREDKEYSQQAMSGGYEHPFSKF